MIDQFDRLRKRNAFLEQYKKEKMFENGLEEFDDARYVLLLFKMPRVTADIHYFQRDCGRVAERVQGLRES